MEENKQVYSLEDIRNKISSEEYNQIVESLAKKVMTYYEEKRTDLNELETTIDEIETKHPDIDKEIRQKVIEKMQSMRFAMQSLYQSGCVQIEAVDDEIKFKTYANIYKQKRRENLGDEVIRTVNEVKKELTKLNEDIEK